LGENEGTATRALLQVVDGAVQARLLRDSCFTRIVDGGGVSTLRGRTRSTYRVWLETSDRVLNHVRLLGLDRRTKAVDPLATIASIVKGAGS
jgi:hypothetical protein